MLVVGSIIFFAKLHQKIWEGKYFSKKSITFVGKLLIHFNY